ncbi:hypothetical protein QR680_014952 [Steinernema hermaphroditum]|uniref:BHLH domain-containing protein n=1 Tax=Steinernema hermaphroditum TaxID=289476 RepID=A0AA39ICW1_9BILA|nr:hypothetical protein QR680_014952 [Steinernema hermaphroditum]
MTSSTTQMIPNYYDSGSSAMSSNASSVHDFYSMGYEIDDDVPLPEAPKEQRVKRKYRTRPKSPKTVMESKVRRRKRANSRERKRMQMLNDALENLRQSLPYNTTNDEQKMTKIETLKCALTYIHDLSEILRQDSTSHVVPHATVSYSPNFN